MNLNRKNLQHLNNMQKFKVTYLDTHNREVCVSIEALDYEDAEQKVSKRSDYYDIVEIEEMEE